MFALTTPPRRRPRRGPRETRPRQRCRPARRPAPEWRRPLPAGLAEVTAEAASGHTPPA